MLKLKLQYFDHLMQRADSIGKDLDAGKDWGQEEIAAAAVENNIQSKQQSRKVILSSVLCFDSLYCINLTGSGLKSATVSATC